MQMIILMVQPFAIDHQDGTTYCKRTSGSTGLLQIIILINQALANDLLDHPATYK